MADRVSGGVVWISSLLVLGAGVAVLAGCANGSVRRGDADAKASNSSSAASSRPSTEPIDPNQPIAIQMLRVAPQLRGHRYSNLLNFESPTDTVFVNATDSSAELDSSRVHTGRNSLKLSGGGELSVKLSSLLVSQSVPGTWTLVGGYFYADAPARIRVSCMLGGTSIAQSNFEIAPGQWSPVMADLANRPEGQEPDPSGPASLRFQIESSGPVWCDDVVLADNTTWIVGDMESAGEGKWTVVRRGLSLICGAEGRFRVRLDAADAEPNGWQLEEANDIRARFGSTGSTKQLTVYSDGRSYWDGKLKPLTPEVRAESFWAQQQASPAELQIPEPMGRVERRSPGDENNDGYNEARASYMIAASGPRLSVTIIPRSVPVYQPMLEISGMPDGNVLVTVEGRLVEKTLRLDDGTLLAEIPTRIERPTTVVLRVQ